MKGSYNTSFTSNKRKEIRKIANRRVFPTSDTGNNDSNETIFKVFPRKRYEKSDCHPLYHKYFEKQRISPNISG